MHRLFRAITRSTLVLSLLATAIIAAGCGDVAPRTVTGTWKMQLSPNSSNTDTNYTMKLTQHDSDVDGTLTNANNHVTLPISGTISGQNITLGYTVNGHTAGTIKGTVSQDFTKITGDFNVVSLGAIPLTATKQ